MPSISSLPSSVILTILQFLTWDEKVNLAKAIPEWQNILFSRSAWHNVEYDHDIVTDDTDVDSFGDKFVNCVEQFGEHFERIKLEFTLEQPATFHNILKVVSKKCNNLSRLELEHFCLNNKNTFDSDYFSTFSLAFCELLQNCNKLKSVKIGSVIVIQYDDKGLESLLSLIIEKGQGHKITELDLFLVSPYGNFYHNNFVLSFDNLRNLAMRVEYLSAETLLILVEKSLTNLALYADDESDTLNDQLRDDVWKTVLSKQPLFRVELELRQRQVTFDDFPRLMPLTKIALTFFRTEIKLEQLFKYVTECYSKNLNLLYFIFDDSEEDEELELSEETEQVSDALIELIRECPKLQYLKYNLPLSSNAVLCIAEQKRLKELCVYENKIYYKDMDPNTQDNILKECGSDKITLEEKVSEFMNKKWTLTPDEEYEIFNH